ncbi:MAG: dehydrogenase [Helicobacteraceae bacterium 4484_230]|nr:MAG: dehydrogenase [Helicobacteraceae bacterium 4484_230]
MNSEYRHCIYAFLSRVMSDMPDKNFLSDLKNNRELAEAIGGETLAWLDESSLEAMIEVLNIDYTSMFIINTQPVESFVLDAKSEIPAGLQNPVMAFYFNHGFDVNMDQTDILAPDHLAIEFAFMQALIYRKELQTQFDFMQEHLLKWAVPYMLGMRSMADTPFYRDICEFTAEFLVSDYEYLAGVSRE